MILLPSSYHLYALTRVSGEVGWVALGRFSTAGSQKRDWFASIQRTNESPSGYSFNHRKISQIVRTHRAF